MSFIYYLKYRSTLNNIFIKEKNCTFIPTNIRPYFRCEAIIYLYIYITYNIQNSKANQTIRFEK